jgi:cyclase
MVMKRIIPCLDVKGGRVVKGVRFRDLRDGGDPVDLARRYYADGADELVFLDIAAGLERRQTVRELVTRVARKVFVPFTVGGGIRSAADARFLLRSGCDKVAVNTAAVRRPELLAELADSFGRQCVVLAVDALCTQDGYRVVVDAGRTVTDLELSGWLRRGQALGAGEILLTAIDADGRQSGYNLESLRLADSVCRVPVIASGGMGTADHMVEALAAGADGVLAASVFHYGRYTIRSLKDELRRRGVEVRPC